MSMPTSSDAHNDSTSVEDLLRTALNVPGVEPAVHNVFLVGVTADANGKEILTVDWAGASHKLSTGGQFNDYSQRDIGRHGYLVRAGRLPSLSYSEECYFRAYLDPSLRRAPELDACSYFPEHNPSVIGWRCSAKPQGFRAPIGLVPGESGAFVPDETISVTIRVPAEFVRLCRQYQLTPERMLRGFVGDASGIHNFVRSPRADDYSSNGSDERNMAEAWVDRAYAGLQIDIDELESRDFEIEEQGAARDDFAAFFDEYTDAGGNPDTLINATQKLIYTLTEQIEDTDERG